MNQLQNMVKPITWSMTMAMTMVLAGIGAPAAASPNTDSATSLVEENLNQLAAPAVISSNPANKATNVATSTNSSGNIVSGTLVSATFNQAMNPATLVSSPAGTLKTFTLKVQNGANVPGTVKMNAANTVAIFTPSALALNTNTTYAATISKAAKTAGGVALSSAYTWTFKTRAVAATAQAPLNLGVAGNFVALAQTGISTVPGSLLTGDIGVSPIGHTAITGFSLTADSSNTFATSPQVVGKVYAADYAVPTPAYMTSAIGDMSLAYTDAAGRSLPNFTELGSGQIGGLTLVPGLYKWGSNVLISSNVTLSGGPNDVWIFQIAGNITQAAATHVTLAGGALAKNIFWQTAGAVSVGASAHFEGVVLAKTLVALKTSASANGRLLAQTAVTLDQNAVTQPAP
jgi:hypothetical protein